MITPSQDYRRTGHGDPPKLFRGLDAAVHGLVGVCRRHGSLTRHLRQQAGQIDALSEQWRKASDHVLREQVEAFSEEFRRSSRDAERFLLPALSLIREIAERQIGLRPFPVQLMGALALHRGYLVEMATGEGKTLTAGLAAVLSGWTRQPTHIITVNDYLVQRDAEWLRPIYRFCGLKVGWVTAAMDPRDRRQGYDCDITYVTSKEVLADFLRDRLRAGVLQDGTRRLIRELLQPKSVIRDALVLRGLHTAIVDEADSVLIDEAVTPLIISAPRKNEDLREACETAHAIISALTPEVHYRRELRYREIELTSDGRRTIAEGCGGLRGIWQSPERRQELIQQALVAREFFHRDKQYILVDGKVVIVDEFTGRPMPQRTWRQGLHQAIEAKEGLAISDPSETISRLSFQRFFRLYRRLSGMTGTAREAAREFWQIYRLAVVRIPTNRPCIRQEAADAVFADEESKWQAVVQEVARIHATGRPILVGTRSVGASEQLAARLADRGLACQVLNAVRHKEEAQIVAEAGHAGRITIATNMAGRGTDIRLDHHVAEQGGLHVLATERHESGRVDRQLFGRSGRQGDPGTAQAFVSAGDELLRRYLPDGVRRRLENALRRSLPGRRRLAAAAFALAQRKAQRIAFKQRRSVLKTDTWLDEALSFTGRGDA